jgi:MurNAc alpha-1-phosphate uridylyltransferase
MTPGLPTQAIILAAGEGRRLRPLTEHVPKPLVPFFGRPLLDWAVHRLFRAGVVRLAVHTAYLAEQVAARVALLAARYPEIDFHISREAVLSGTGGGVRLQHDWLAPEPFLVVNADTIVAEDLAVLAGTAPALLVTRAPALASERRIVPLGTAPMLTWKGLVEGGDSDAFGPDAFAFTGVTLADAGLPSRLPPGVSCILRQGFLPFLATRPVRLVATTAFVADVGTPAALIAAHAHGLAWVAAPGDHFPR